MQKEPVQPARMYQILQATPLHHLKRTCSTAVNLPMLRQKVKKPGEVQLPAAVKMSRGGICSWRVQ